MSQAAVDTYAGISGDLQMDIADSAPVLWIATASLVFSVATTRPAAAASKIPPPPVQPRPSLRSSCPG